MRPSARFVPWLTLVAAIAACAPPPTSSATGAFMNSGGSCGCGFGRFFGSPLKNTSWMKRSE